MGLWTLGGPWLVKIGTSNTPSFDKSGMNHREKSWSPNQKNISPAVPFLHNHFFGNSEEQKISRNSVTLVLFTSTSLWTSSNTDQSLFFQRPIPSAFRYRGFPHLRITKNSVSSKHFAEANLWMKKNHVNVRQTWPGGPLV